jgi:hypothetical protein
MDNMRSSSCVLKEFGNIFFLSLKRIENSRESFTSKGLILGQQETTHTHTHTHTKHTHDLLASHDTSPLASKITHVIISSALVKERWCNKWFLFIFLVASSCHFVKNILEKEYFVTNSRFFLGGKTSFIKKSNLFVRKLQNFVTIPWVLKIYFLLSIFGYRQFWLNVLMNDCHLSNITKLKNKNTGCK